MTTEAEKALDTLRQSAMGYIKLMHSHEAWELDKTVRAALQAQQKPKQTLKDLTDKITDENRHDPVPENRHEAAEDDLKARMQTMLNEFAQALYDIATSKTTDAKSTAEKALSAFGYGCGGGGSGKIVGAAYDKDAAYAEIVARNAAFTASLKKEYTDEERNKIVEDNYRGAD